MTTNNSPQLTHARLGSVSSDTLRTEDLISTFARTLERLIFASGDFLSRPENFPMRDRLNALVGEAQDCFADDGETIDPEKEDDAVELVNETLPDALNEFAPPYAHFGSHEGDGACFGFWLDLDSAREGCEFVSVKSHADAERMGIATDPDDSGFPPADFRGEWLHINDRGNTTLYVREDAPSAGGYNDRELWSLVCPHRAAPRARL
jgi:hypothetical protein